MNFTQTLKLGLAVVGLCTIGTAAKPAAAQNLVYTLSGVTFSDGATGSGSFTFNPATGTMSAGLTTFNIATTAGVTDSLTAGSYTSGSATAFEQQNSVFSFDYGDGSTSFHDLTLMTTTAVGSVGTYSLVPGTVTARNQFVGSGEYAPTFRLLTSGFLIVTPAAVPEASTTISFGLLLAFGVGGAVSRLGGRRPA